MREPAEPDRPEPETRPTERDLSQRDLSENDIFALERPEPALLYYYAAGSLLLGPFCFFVLIPLYFRYRTLRYRFDDEGVSMSWGVLFHREINLTYARIQDIHLVSNVVERWLGLARIKIQTASGSSKAEMTVEGIAEFQALRDFLYNRMRGTRASASSAPRERGHRDPSSAGATLDGDVATELIATLRDVARELRAVRLALENRPASASEAADA